MRRNLANNLLLVVVVSMCLLTACTGKRKVSAIPPAKLEAVLYDYHLAQVIVGDLPSNQRYTKDLYFDYIYAKHGVTKAEIDSSLAYYSRYPEGLSEIYISLSDRIKAEIERLGVEDQPIRLREAISVVGDSVDLWYDLPVVQMTSSPLGDNRYAFTIPTDSNFHVGDRLAWSGKALFLQGGVDSLYRYLHLNLKVTYMNDSIVSADTLLYTSGTFSLAVSDSALVKSINGTAYLKSRDADERLLIVSPSLVRCRRVEHSDSLRVDSLNNR